MVACQGPNIEGQRISEFRSYTVRTGEGGKKINTAGGDLALLGGDIWE